MTIRRLHRAILPISLAVSLLALTVTARTTAAAAEPSGVDAPTILTGNYLASSTSTGDQLATEYENEASDPSLHPYADSAALSGDGRLVAFNARAENLPGGLINQLGYVKDILTGSVELVTSTQDGQAIPPGTTHTDFTQGSSIAALSDDGQLVLFSSTFAFDPGDNDNVGSDVYLKNRATGAVTWVSRLPSGDPGFNGDVAATATSSDLRFIALHASSSSDVWIYDRVDGTYDQLHQWPDGITAISDDGRYLLGDQTSGGTPIIYDRSQNQYRTFTNLPASDANMQVAPIGLLRDGSAAIIQTLNQYLNQPQLRQNLWLVPLDGSPASLISVGADGAPLPGGGFGSNRPSDNGTIVFGTLTDSDTSQTVFAWSPRLRYATPVSTANDANSLNAAAFRPAISANGDITAYSTTASNAVPGLKGSFQNVIAAPTFPANVTPSDTTAPNVDGTLDRAANDTGWFNAPVTATWISSDPDPSSGPPSLPPPTTYAGPDGTGQTVTSNPSCDPAGNCATGSVTINYDSTPPIVTTTETGAAGSNGWFHGPVTVHFTCTDATSGVESCPPDQTVTQEGTTTVTGSALDTAGNTSSVSAQIRIDTTPPTITATADTTGWTNHPVTVHFTCADATSGMASCPGDMQISHDGTSTLTGTAIDGSGATASVTVTVQFDGTAPTITAVPASAANAAGWYNTPVTIHYSCADALSGVAICSADQVLLGDGPAIAYSGTAVDVAGNVSTVAGSVAIDETAPTVAAAADRGPDHGIWYTSPVAVHFTCADETSGVASCPPDQTISTDGEAIIAAGTATDVAGNTATATVTVPMDRDAPTITATTDRPPNGAGWYAGPVTVHYVCADATSGVATCPPDQTIKNEGTTTVNGAATDNAGNSASTSLVVKIDDTAPTVTANPDRPPNPAGWYTGPVTVHYTCSDITSGVSSCPSDQTVTADGTTHLSATASDTAGNTAPAATDVNLDTVPPTVTATLSQAPNSNGWNNAPVTVAFQCSDLTSGVAHCPGPQTVTGDGDHIVTASGTDAAGNDATATIVVHLDATHPALALNADRSANSHGWYNAPVTVHATCTDATSGIASCPPDQTVTIDGATDVSGTATDNADNSTTADLNVALDQIAPTIAAATDRGPNDAGWYTAPVTVHYTCADTGSGVATCPTDSTITTDGLTEVVATTRDNADNTRSTTTDVRVDQTAPTISATVVGPNSIHGWYDTAVTVHFTCTDATSGVATCPADQTVTTDGSHTVTGVAIDGAGNHTTSSITVNVDQTAPAITATASQPPNGNGWNDTPVTVHFTCSDTTSGIATCPADQTITTDGTATVTGVAVDTAGNTATVALTISVDRSGPTIVLTPTRAADSNGWYNAPVAVHATCIDTGSGIAACPGDQTVTNDGTTIITDTATDRAGNTTLATLGIDMDRTPPTITATASGTTGLNNWYTGPVTVHYTCGDTTSGIATCPADQTITTDGTSTVSATATDTAANTASTSLTIKIDRTRPAGTITTPNNTIFVIGGQLTGTATDATSGISTITITFTRLSTTITVTGTATCDPQRKSCTWTAPIPAQLLGTDTATAKIQDNAGNTTTTPPTHFTAIATILP